MQEPQSSSKFMFNRVYAVTEFADRRHHPCHNTKVKLKSRGGGGKRYPTSGYNPFAKWNTLRAWEGREGRWTESADDGPASENDGTCLIMGDRRLSSPKSPVTTQINLVSEGVTVIEEMTTQCG